VTIAIALRLDGATASRVAAFAEALPDRLHDVARLGPSDPAHIILAAYSDRIDVADLDAALATATGSWRTLSVTLGVIGVVPDDPASAISFLAIPTVDLLRRHAILHRALADVPSHPAYQIDAWTPAVIVGVTSFLGDSVEVLASLWNGPITGRAVSLDLVRLNPMTVISARRLLG